ncbi:gamma carbonic anhydrase 1, mitochondrial isoform X2 [Rosa chinensis]|nr:gamma carbonic anhydrase 1, mitochondrial isoform X2 [Rosa chinensis]
MNVFDKAPVVDKDAFVAPSASIVGDVQVGRGSSIWYGCVLSDIYLSYSGSITSSVHSSLCYRIAAGSLCFCKWSTRDWRVLSKQGHWRTLKRKGMLYDAQLLYGKWLACGIKSSYNQPL